MSRQAATPAATVLGGPAIRSSVQTGTIVWRFLPLSRRPPQPLHWEVQFPVLALEMGAILLSRKLFANVNSLFATESKVVIMGRHLARQS